MKNLAKNSLVSKNELKQLILAAFEQNPLMLNFVKFDHRTYFFSRQDGDILDYIKIQVNFLKGTFWCFLVATKSGRIKREYVFNDEFNRADYFINPKKYGESFPINILYKFENTKESIYNSFICLINDLYISGESFFQKSHMELNQKLDLPTTPENHQGAF